MRRNNIFSTPTRATDNKVPDGTFTAWTLGLRDAPKERTKNYPAVILPVACNVNGSWQTVEKLLWLPADGHAPSVDSELVQMLCAINGVSATTETDLSDLSDVVPITVQIINQVTEKLNARGQMQQFYNPAITAYLPRTATADETLPPELMRDASGSVISAE